MYILCICTVIYHSVTVFLFFVVVLCLFVAAGGEREGGVWDCLFTGADCCILLGIKTLGGLGGDKT